MFEFGYGISPVSCVDAIEKAFGSYNDHSWIEKAVYVFLSLSEMNEGRACSHFDSSSIDLVFNDVVAGMLFCGGLFD